MKPADPAAAALDALVDRLHGRGRLRVWSLVITMLGDAVVPRGGRVALSSLQDILERLRVEAGALRTAMSRLARDGWVIRQREGRHSYFRLDERGRHAFDLATRRIYAGGAPAWNGTWSVAIGAPGLPEPAAAELAALGFVRINGAVHLRPETADSPDASGALAGMLVIHGGGTEHPEVFRSLWPSEAIASGYEAFIASYGGLAGALASGGSLAPREAMAARTLLIHDWRRIVLRDPGLPAALLPAGWPGQPARALMHGIYAALRPASETWLDGAGI